MIPSLSSSLYENLKKHESTFHYDFYFNITDIILLNRYHINIYTSIWIVIVASSLLSLVSWLGTYWKNDHYHHLIIFLATLAGVIPKRVNRVKRKFQATLSNSKHFWHYRHLHMTIMNYLQITTLQLSIVWLGEKTFYRPRKQFFLLTLFKISIVK